MRHFNRSDNLIYELKKAKREIRNLKKLLISCFHKIKELESNSDSIPLDEMIYLFPEGQFNYLDDLYATLRKYDIIDNNEYPKLKYIEEGYFIVKIYSRTTAFGEIKCDKVLVTEKGQEWILNKLKEYMEDK